MLIYRRPQPTYFTQGVPAEEGGLSGMGNAEKSAIPRTEVGGISGSAMAEKRRRSGSSADEIINGVETGAEKSSIPSTEQRGGLKN